MAKLTKKAKVKIANTEEERNIILKNIMKDINKKYGKEVIKWGSDEKEKQRISTGIESVDKFTGGGIVRGNFSILWGGESCGKTSLAYHMIAKNQQDGLKCALFDLEHTFDPLRAKSFGIDLKTLIIINQVENAEQAMDILIGFAKEKVIDIAVVDSIQAMSPTGEQETKTGKSKSVEDDTMALLARKMGQFLRMSKDFVYQGQIGVLLIGQVRIGGIGGFAPRATLTGGNALKHYSMLTLFIRKGQKADAPVEKYKEYFIDEKTGKERYKTLGRPIGFDCVIKVEKQKISGCQPELSDMHLPFYNTTGFLPPVVVEDETEDTDDIDETKE